MGGSTGSPVNPTLSRQRIASTHSPTTISTWLNFIQQNKDINVLISDQVLPVVMVGDPQPAGHSQVGDDAGGGEGEGKQYDKNPKMSKTLKKL